MFNLQFIARLLACCVYPREGRTKKFGVCVYVYMQNKRVHSIVGCEKGHEVPLSAKSMNDIENKAN